MAFESLADKLQNVFKNLRGKGRLSEADVKAALKEVKMALLEADVSFKVVKQFINSVQERAVGQDVLNSLTPGQMVIKIVNEELVNLMGSETTEIELKAGGEITVIMMAGLQGAGKTTTTAKLAGKFKSKGKKPLLAACDVYRPAAIEQLQINGDKQGVPVFSMGTGNKPVNIAKAALEHAAKNGFNVVILDTAGRLHVDEDMMNELIEIKEQVEVHQTILVVDAMTGQDAVNVAGMFNDKIGIDGVILTKQRRRGAFHPRSHGQADFIRGYGREAIRSGAVLPGPHGIQNPGDGRYPVAHREGGDRGGRGEGERAFPETQEGRVRLQRFSGSDASDQEDGRHGKHYEHDARHGTA